MPSASVALVNVCVLELDITPVFLTSVLEVFSAALSSAEGKKKAPAEPPSCSARS